MIYGNRSNGNPHGLVLTKSIVVEFMLNRAGYSSSNNLSKIKVIEPAAGDGAFAVEIIKRLHESSINFGFSFKEALKNIRFFELDEKTFLLLKERIEKLFSSFSEKVPESLLIKGDFLLSKGGTCDLVIGNPPYVRHENIPEDLKAEYRKRFSTFRHRSDLYIAFYEKGLRFLNEGGILSFICSNRWLKNQYGKSLRELIKLSYSIEEVIDLEETSPFEEEVIAYPAITTIREGESSGKSHYFQISNLDELSSLEGHFFKAKILNTKNSTNWFSYQSSEPYHRKFLDSIENQGFKIGIGVATGSDQVFIGKNFHGLIEDELLLPILLSKDLKNNKISWSGNYIVNPYDLEGRLIDLEDYPLAKRYFESKKELLEKRHVAKQNPKSWFKTIDKILAKLAKEPKILLPDISGNTHLLIDWGNFYPHHNLYYITNADSEKLMVLAAVLMSDFVKKQLLEIGNKMNGGYPRWQSQNLRKLQIPVINAMPFEDFESLVAAYQRLDYELINTVITEEKISAYSFNFGQTVLFEPEPESYGLDR